MDVDTFSVRLTTLPSLTRTDIASYQQRSAHKGVDLLRIFREAQGVDRRRKQVKIREKVQDFTRLVRELPLSRAAFTSLVKTIKEDTDVYKLKQRAQIFADRRNNQEMGKLQKNFYDTLKKLNIDQTDIADLIRRFDGGEDVGVLTKKAYDLERKKKIEKRFRGTYIS